MRVHEESFDGHEAATGTYPKASIVVVYDGRRPLSLFALLRAWWNGRVAFHARRGVREIDLRYET